MQLPIDLKALIDEATDIKAAQSTKIAVSVYIDGQAQNDVAAHVRGAFASTLPTVRMTVSYLDDTFMPHPSDDMAVLVAGPSRGVGPAAAAVRAAGVPVMVVTAHPKLVADQARELGYEISEADIVAPFDVDEAASTGEPVELTPELAAELDARMGRWVVAVCREKRLAMSIAFPFMRRSLATDAVQATSLQNAGIGLVPIIPGADLPIMTLNQAKMVLQIAAAYGQEMNKGRAKELAVVLGGAYICRVIARELAEFVPVLGFIIKPGIAYGGTAAIGYAAIEYFEGGEDVAGVMNVATSAAEAGTKLVTKVREQGPTALPNLFGKAVDLGAKVPGVYEKAREYAPRVAAVVNDLASSVVAQSSTASTN